MENLIIRCVDLPYCTNGYVDVDSEGDYNVYINARLSFDGQRRTLIHELLHIRRSDLFNDIPIQEVESDATIQKE